jgi:hypothetical protein
MLQEIGFTVEIRGRYRRTVRCWPAGRRRTVSNDLVLGGVADGFTSGTIVAEKEQCWRFLGRAIEMSLS